MKPAQSVKELEGLTEEFRQTAADGGQRALTAVWLLMTGPQAGDRSILDRDHDRNPPYPVKPRRRLDMPA